MYLLTREKETIMCHVDNNERLVVSDRCVVSVKPLYQCE